MSTADYKLFTPLTIGEGLTLKNRVVLAPMGRARSDPVRRTPIEINGTYYEQRAGAGLLITESTAVSEQGYGWYGSPALYTEAHAADWKKVTDRVHAKNSKIFVQLWHMGRAGHTSFNAKNDLVSASALVMPGSGHTRNIKGEAVPYETPRALETGEIAGLVEDYRRSAELAKAAGFDGVELQGGNGYLLDQFFQSVTNHRTDQYGGSFENRTRILFEIIDALKTVWPADRIAVRLSPNSSFNSMGAPDNAEFFTYVMERLSHHGLAYLAMLDGFGFGVHDKGRLLTALDAKTQFKGTVLAANSYTRDIAEGAIRSGTVDFVCFGRAHLSNPDLAERFENDWPLAPEISFEYYYDTSKGVVGYIDYPACTPSVKMSISQ